MMKIDVERFVYKTLKCASVPYLTNLQIQEFIFFKFIRNVHFFKK